VRNAFWSYPLLGSLCAGLFTLGACQPRERPATSGAEDTAAMADTGARATTQGSLDDPTALATFEALVTYDIETAGIAAKKSAKSDIRDLASSFEQGHRGLLKQAEDLAKKLNMTPTPPKEAPLGQAHADALRKLNGTTGEEFDRVFLANEVAYHDGAIKILNETLLPAIKNPELKAAVTAAVPAFQAHLAASQKAAAKYHVS
jgi:putative membrane protein